MSSIKTLNKLREIKAQYVELINILEAEIADRSNKLQCAMHKPVEYSSEIEAYCKLHPETRNTLRYNLRQYKVPYKSVWYKNKKTAYITEKHILTLLGNIAKSSDYRKDGTCKIINKAQTSKTIISILKELRRLYEEEKIKAR